MGVEALLAILVSGLLIVFAICIYAADRREEERSRIRNCTIRGLECGDWFQVPASQKRYIAMDFYSDFSNRYALNVDTGTRATFGSETKVKRIWVKIQEI